MAHYDNSKDAEVQKFSQKTWGLTRIRLTMHSYDGGEPKLQIIRQRRNDEDSDDWKFSKLGRLNHEEVRWLGKMMRKKVVPWYDSHFAGESEPNKKKKGGKKKAGKGKVKNPRNLNKD